MIPHLHKHSEWLRFEATPNPLPYYPPDIHVMPAATRMPPLPADLIEPEAASQFAQNSWQYRIMMLIHGENGETIKTDGFGQTGLTRRDYEKNLTFFHIPEYRISNRLFNFRAIY